MNEAVERIKGVHERATSLRAEADAASRERNTAVADALDAGEVRGPELARALGLSTQRLYDMANRARRGA